MNELVYIIKIVYYYVFVVMMNYSASINLNIPYVFSKKSTIGKSSRVGIVWVIILGFMIGYYAIICGHDPYVSDRYNYAVRFETDGLLDSVRQQSIGLYFIYLILQYFTHDARILFFFITFLCFTVTIKAYNFFEEASKDTLLFLGLSSYIYCSFFLLKQAPAIAFSSLAFSYYLKKRKIAFVVSLFIAIAFHESAWILVLVLLLCKFSENRKMCNFLIIAIMISMIFFNPITHFLAVLFGYIPGLAEQMPAYFLETGINSGDIRYITIFKGAPYYYIFFWGYLKKKSLSKKINNFNVFIIISLFVSVCFLLSAYQYWMWRFGILCFVPVFVFASRICQELNANNRLLFKYPLMMMLFLLTTYALYEYFFIWGGF